MGRNIAVYDNSGLRTRHTRVLDASDEALPRDVCSSRAGLDHARALYFAPSEKKELTEPLPLDP